MHYDERRAERYDRHRGGAAAAAVAEAVERLLAGRPHPRVLDAGCGTGRLAVALARRASGTLWGAGRLRARLARRASGPLWGAGRLRARLGEAHVVAVDRSRAMLRRAAAKDRRPAWARADLRRLPFRDGAFDVAVGAYVLHQLGPDLEAALGEFARVASGGWLVFLTSLPDQIRDYALSAYFPHYVEIDLDRFPGLDRIARILAPAGFRIAACREVRVEGIPVDEALCRKIADRYVSTYDLLPPGELEAGLRRLRRDIAAGRAPAAKPWRGTIITAASGA